MKKSFNIFIFVLELITLLFSYDFLLEHKLTLYSLLNPFGGSLLIGLILAYIKRDKLKELSKYKKVLVIIFTLFMIFGEVIDTAHTIGYFFKVDWFLLTMIKTMGYICIFNNVLKLVDYEIHKERSFKKKLPNIVKRYESALINHPFRTSFISIFLVIVIFMIAFYPIVLSPDPSYQIKMYYNVPTKYIRWVIQRDPNVFMTNHHPILQTFLLGWAIDIGRHILDDNFGLFLYTITQSLIYASCLAFTVKFLHKHEVKSKYLLLITLMYMIVPMFAFYSVSAVKDTYYTVFFIYLTLFTYEFVEDKRKKIKLKDMCLLFIVSLFLCLFRQNGSYIIYILFPILAIYSFKNFSKILFVFLMIIASVWSYNHVLIPYLGVSDGSIREALSVPFQQTARLVKYHEDVISESDKEIIDKILVYDTIAERYDPILSDKVKNEFNKDATKDDLKAYFKVWFKYLIKEPACYINATLENTSGYFYPYKLRWYFYHNYDNRVRKGEKPVNYHYNKLGIIRTSLSNYAIIYPYIPVIGLLSNIGFGTFSVLYLISDLLEKKRRRFIIVLIPLIISILVCFVGPANTYFRYAMPYLFVLPTLEILHKKENEV